MTYASSKAWYAKNKDRQAKSIRRRRAEDPAPYLFKAIEQRAVRKGQAVEITVDDVRRMLAPGVCSVTGIQLEPLNEEARHYRSPWTPSIDRIDNSLGYVLGNVRIVCWAYNAAKQDWDDDTVLLLAANLLEKQNAD